MTTVWVTGASGFTGRYLTQHIKLASPLVRIVGIDIHPQKTDCVDESLCVDLCDSGDVKRALQAEPPGIVIHLAGLMPPVTEQELMRVNVDASVTLAESIKAVGTEKTRLVSAGSAAEYGGDNENPGEDAVCNPTSPYGRSKYEQTSRLLSSNSPLLEVLVARPFNLIGPGLSENLVAGGLCRQFSQLGDTKRWIEPRGPIESVRDFVDVRDVASAYWMLATSGEPGQIYNVCAGKGASISQLIDIMARKFNLEVEVRPDYDASIVHADHSVGQNQKLRALGWLPQFSLEDSVAAMVDAVSNEQ